MRKMLLMCMCMAPAFVPTLAAKDKKAEPRKWVTGTVLDVSASQATANDSRVTATDYTIQVADKLYLIRPDPARGAKVAEKVVGIAKWGDPVQPVSKAIPGNVGEPITIALQGSRAWVLGANGKEYGCNVLRQTYAPQPVATKPAQPAPRREIDPPDRPTLRQEPASDSQPKASARPAEPLPALPRNYDSPPQLSLKREPDYTSEARVAGIEGTVVLLVTVGTDGLPRDVRAVRSLGYGLDEKAAACVQDWRFHPGLKDGRPVPVAAYIEVNFHAMAEAQRQ